MLPWKIRPAVLCVGLALAVWGAYANHFQNEFHFDDIHTVINNPFIRDLRFVPRFFADARLFSTVPQAASYRPLVSTSLALDYWLAGGLQPFWFHCSTFLWFLLQLVLMFFLFRRMMDLADPHPSNVWWALAAAACYGLHPAAAETVNYVIQRSDLYSTLGVVASLLWFVARPAQRRRGYYLLPAVAAYLSKPPALIFPVILWTYIFLFEHDAVPGKWKAALRDTVPALAVTAAAVVLTVYMTPATFSGGAASPSLYRLTQPWVALHYFVSFFLPLRLSADSNWSYVSGPFSLPALAGYLFIAALAFAAARTAGNPKNRPISFGIIWFLAALLPTSLMPLADLMNDHRMFFPFVGLVLAVVWGLKLASFRQTARRGANRTLVRASVAGFLIVLAAAAAGTHRRNEVWHTEQSLWRDASEKDPGNGRALANYGHSFLIRGDAVTALPWLQRAETLRPNDSALEIDLALAFVALGRDEAARHFELAESLEPNNPQAYCYYGHWLKDKGRLAEAQAQLEAALRLSPGYQEARDLLAQVMAAKGNAPSTGATPEALLNQSAEFCKTGRYPECLAAAVEALKLRPGWAEAYGNMSAAFLSMERWDEGIQAAQQALAIKPDLEMARSNLEWALQHRKR